MKIKKKMGGGGEGWMGVRVDVIEELKFTKKKFRGGGEDRVWGSGWM